MPKWERTKGNRLKLQLGEFKSSVRKDLLIIWVEPRRFEISAGGFSDQVSPPRCAKIVEAWEAGKSLEQCFERFSFSDGFSGGKGLHWVLRYNDNLQTFHCKKQCSSDVGIIICFWWTLTIPGLKKWMLLNFFISYYNQQAKPMMETVNSVWWQTSNSSVGQTDSNPSDTCKTAGCPVMIKAKRGGNSNRWWHMGHKPCPPL